MRETIDTRNNINTIKIKIMKTMEIYVIEFTENTGRTYIVDITNDVDKWLIDNNSEREEEDKEDLLTFSIEKHNLKLY